MSEPSYTGTGTSFYYAPKAVADTVNLAVALGRPLLVEGEPGCGKTKLAYSVAAEKCLPEPIKISIKSTTRARDLLYGINSLRRLQEAQDPQNKDAKYVYPYLSLGVLGQAIHAEKRAVLLIDEVDKADIDFPNDLLDVLESFSFQIEELPPAEEASCQETHGFGRTVKGGGAVRPIVIVTSNREKRLPEAFLRRCLFVRLRFPETHEELCDIVTKNIDIERLNRTLLDAAVSSFQTVRTTALGATHKPPTTSELIDWVRILYWREVKPESRSDTRLPPYWETLFKSGADLDSYAALRPGKRG
jgi:MoxR-like ATPase